MTLPVVWLPEADAELKEALARYETIRPELPQRFAEAVADTVEAISGGPCIMQLQKKGDGGPECGGSPTGCSFSWNRPGSW